MVFVLWSSPNHATIKYTFPMKKSDDLTNVHPSLRNQSSNSWFSIWDPINKEHKGVFCTTSVLDLDYNVRATSHTTPRAVTMKFWRPKRKCPKAVPSYLQIYVVWSQTLNCSVKSYVTGPSTKCYFKKTIVHADPHTWWHRINRWFWAFRFSCSLQFCVRPPSKRWFLKILQSTMTHDPSDAT